MNKLFYSSITSICLSLCSASYAAEFSRPFDSNMVLPHSKEVPVWGKGTPGEKVIVSFADQKHTATTNQDGIWKVTFAPLKIDNIGKKLTLTSATDPITLENILVGEVWLASGQSNMEWQMKRFPDTKEDIASSENPNFRIVQYLSALPPVAGKYKAETFDKITKENAFTGNWKSADPKSVADFSATAYYFGNQLQKKLDIPVGIICNAVGGSPIEAWYPPSLLKKKEYQSLAGDQWLTSPDMPAWPKSRGNDNLSELLKTGRKDLNHPFKPGYLFDFATSWLTEFPFTGVIWYQGESNAEVNDIPHHKKSITNMVQAWRKDFKRPDLPIFMIQLPRINCATALRKYWPEYREAQKQASQGDQNTHLICTIDLGGTDSNVHPGKKKPLGERMANLALNKVYGKEGYASASIIKTATKGKQLIALTSAQKLTTTDGSNPKCFELAGADGIYHPAQASIQQEEGKSARLIITSPEVEKPVSLRYAYKVFVEPNLIDENDLPLFPFTSK